MHTTRTVLTVALASVALASGLTAAVFGLRESPPRAWQPGGSTFDVEITVPGSPAEVFDAFTGDVLPWWDHHVSESPKAMYIEPEPGGAFLEVFDDAGNGVEHARVTGVERGKWLRMVGPLGLAGNGVNLEMSLTFDAVEDGTRVRLVVHALGKIDDKLAGVVHGVWKHFLVERFEPYVRSGRHRAR